MQGGELAKVGVAHVHIEGLALVNERAAVCRPGLGAAGSAGPARGRARPCPWERPRPAHTCRHVHQHTLLDLPHRLVKLLEVVGDVQVLAEVGGWGGRGSGSKQTGPAAARSAGQRVQCSTVISEQAATSPPRCRWRPQSRSSRRCPTGPGESGRAASAGSPQQTHLQHRGT